MALFTTIMNTPDNIRIIIPNSKIFGDTIKNFSAEDTRRVDMVIGIGYGSGIDAAFLYAETPSTHMHTIKVAMIELQREMDATGLQAKMILQVHDELLFELPREEVDELTRLVQRIMPNALKITVPLKIDVKTGTNWDEMEYIGASNA